MTNRAFPRQHRNRQRALDRPHTTIKRKLTNAENVNEVVRLSEVAARSKNSERNRQIEASPFFANVGGSEVDRSLLKRKKVTAVLNCRAYAFARLANSSVRKSNDGDRRYLVTVAAHSG